MPKELTWALDFHIRYEHHDSWLGQFGELPTGRVYPYIDAPKHEIKRDRAIFYSDAGRCHAVSQMKKYIRQIVRGKHRTRVRNELRKATVDPDYDPSFKLEKEKDVWVYN